MVAIKEENITQKLELLISNDYFNCFISKKGKYIICETLVSYIPVEAFMDTFDQLISPIEEFKIKKFIFDKRSLRAFHQPTMEWYFVEWKSQLLEYGLSVHRKILPQEPWFRKCVEAGKAQILEDNPHLPIDKLDIQYFETIQECIEH